MEVVQVQPRDSYLHNIYVPTRGTVIRWSFTTKRNNISFGLFRRKGKEPLPNSSDIVFRAQQQLQKRQMSIPSELGVGLRMNSQGISTFFSRNMIINASLFWIESTHITTVAEDDTENTYASNQSIHSQTTTNSRPRSKSVATIKLKEVGLDEIIPIQHAQSSDQKVEGTYVVEDPGNYVLVFGK
jgi:hypothetical protein